MKNTAFAAMMPIILLLNLSCGDAIGPGDIIGGNDIVFASLPGGTFQMGDVEGAGELVEQPVHTVTLSPFEMGVFEVTNAQYARYLNDAFRTGAIVVSRVDVVGAAGLYSGLVYIFLAGTVEAVYPGNRCWIVFTNGAFNVIPGHENWPVVFVTWYGAKAFARFYGFDLPTESEWEFASRGGLQLPFGTSDGTISPTLANYIDSNIGRPTTVGRYPANPFGLFDLSGNVWEWCHDRFGPYPSGAVLNPVGSLSGLNRVLRGGSWENTPDVLRSAHRSSITPDFEYYAVGFRVVRRASGQIY